MPALRSPVSLFLIATAVWGSTWLAIKFQLGVVAPEISVAYRFALAAVLLAAWWMATGRLLRFSGRALRDVGSRRGPVLDHRIHESDRRPPAVRHTADGEDAGRRGTWGIRRGAAVCAGAAAGAARRRCGARRRLRAGRDADRLRRQSLGGAQPAGAHCGAPERGLGHGLGGGLRRRGRRRAGGRVDDRPAPRVSGVAPLPRR